jgi:hypothetical protein
MKKRIFALIIVVFCIYIIGNNIYNTFYRIDTKQYKYSFLSRIVPSPDDNYQIVVLIEKTTEESEISYIKGSVVKKSINDSGEVSYNHYKTILWQKQNSKDIVDNMINVEWISNEVVTINNITLNIHKDVYDYRRSWLY